MTGEMQPASIVIRSERLVAEISPHGAELIRLQDRDGKDLLWNGCAKWWTGRAPLLFPIVGGLPNNAVMIDGETFSMRQHGFARNKQFSVVGASASGCSFRLASDDETRRQFPFDFVLEVAFVIEGAALRIGATVFNKSSRAMPVSFGFHPAFRWPLPYGGSRQDHEIRFERSESAPIRRLTDGLLDVTASMEIFEGSTMSPDDAMFGRRADLRSTEKPRCKFRRAGRTIDPDPVSGPAASGSVDQARRRFPVHRTLAGLCSSLGICR
jgi:galactose mutarotase-like enzyme